VCYRIDTQSEEINDYEETKVKTGRWEEDTQRIKANNSTISPLDEEEGRGVEIAHFSSIERGSFTAHQKQTTVLKTGKQDPWVLWEEAKATKAIKGKLPPGGHADEGPKKDDRLVRGNKKSGAYRDRGRISLTRGNIRNIPLEGLLQG